MKMTTLEKSFVNSPGHSRRVARLFERRLRHIPEIAPGMPYLDVGCGNGAAAIHIARAFGLDVTGVDADPRQIRLAAEALDRTPPGVAGRVRFEQALAERLPFADGAFAIAASNKVTHHVSRWWDALAEMARVVARGGYVVFGDFVFPEWMARIGPSLVPAAGFPTERGLEAAAESVGLAPIHWSRSLVTLDAVWWKPGVLGQ
jgi:ubiquinone/menaquinone biosynthesis C-methylase UbiE